MGRIRRCNGRCHNAKRPRCKCWCGGAYHGSAGATNRQALQAGITEILSHPDFKQGETAYIEQTKLPEPEKVVS